MIRILYHGTNEQSALSICNDGIDFSKSKNELDFGKGFYLTDDVNVARRRAIKKTQAYNRRYKVNDNPAIVEIQISTDKMMGLNLKEFEYCNQDWLYFILANRLSYNYLNLHPYYDHNLDLKYDIVVGSIADSDVTTLANNVEQANMDIADISVYDILTDEGKTLGWQMSLHTQSSLSIIVSKCYNTIELQKGGKL